MTESDKETGLVKSVERLTDDEGRSVLRATVDFYEGNCPDLTFATVWERRPVKIVELRADGESEREGK